jgi:hypothetical protein
VEKLDVLIGVTAAKGNRDDMVDVVIASQGLSTRGALAALFWCLCCAPKPVGI